MLPHAHPRTDTGTGVEAPRPSTVPGTEEMPRVYFYVPEADGDVVGKCVSPGFSLPGFGSPPRPGPVALGKVVSLSVTHFPHLRNGRMIGLKSSVWCQD